LCIPVALAVDLGLQLVNVTKVELADGRITEELVFAGEVQMGDTPTRVEIYLTKSNESLIGTRLLTNNTLKIDFRSSELTIEERI